MGVFEICVIALLAVAVILLVVVLIVSLRKRADTSVFSELTQDINRSLAESRQETVMLTQNSIKMMGDGLNQSQQVLQKTVNDSLHVIDERFKSFSQQNEMQLSNMRTTMESRLAAIQEGNEKKLEQMRATVDEKLQKTLEDRIGQSFKLVSERLEQVYKGLGEMQTLAAGVGDLKKVLSNVKNRGTLGEIQLGAILEQMLAPEQYEAQCQTKPGTLERVDYAVKMPADDGGFVYLPIDAKFPMDAYNDLIDAYDEGSPDSIKAASTTLFNRIKLFAKDINAKYINPPDTTDFAVLFLPVEGLYAEVVRGGLPEQLQREYKVTIAGPTTMSALLNSLQMGFRTLAIQKRSGEVWKVLGAVKSEFEKFGAVLATTQQNLERANRNLDELVGVRTRQIQRSLKEVEALPTGESAKLLDEEGFEPELG